MRALTRGELTSSPRRCAVVFSLQLTEAINAPPILHQFLHTPTDCRLRPLRDLLNVGRLLHVVVQLDHTDRPIHVIAHDLRFDNATFRRLCQRELHYPPAQLRLQGAVQTALERLRIHQELR